MLTAVAEMQALDDRRLAIRLHRPFLRLLDAMAKPSPMFVMPERIALTDPSVAITDPTGSGPYRFRAAEWVIGAHAAYERFADYTPRDEPARMLAGGKRAWFDRIEWQFIADPATAAAALRTGEIDWLEAPHADLLTSLARSPDIEVAQLNPFGTICALRPNHAQPPFSNPALRAALWPALNQDDVMAAVAGVDPVRRSDRLGYFAPGTPLANDAGMQALTSPRSLDAAKRAVDSSGYAGQTIVFLQPSDIAILNASGSVMVDLLRRVGLNVEPIQADWATIAQRRARRDPVSQGGWSAFCTVLSGSDCLNPGANPLLRADGAAAFFGWPDIPKLEAERLAWFDTPDLQAQQRNTEAIQRQAFLDVPYWPLGQFMQPTAYRRGMTGFVRAPVPVPWNVSKVS
jgi:peptide/nickel transport system substrate-binding protein